MKAWLTAFVVNSWVSFGHLSSYWTYAFGMVAAWYIQAPIEQIDWVLSLVPVVHLASADVSPLKGIVTFLVGYVALKGWPQGGDTEKAAEILAGR